MAKYRIYLKKQGSKHPQARSRQSSAAGQFSGGQKGSGQKRSAGQRSAQDRPYPPQNRSQNGTFGAKGIRISVPGKKVQGRPAKGDAGRQAGSVRKQRPSGKRNRRTHDTHARYRVKPRFKVLMITLFVLLVAGFNYLLSPLVGQDTGEELRLPDKVQSTAVQGSDEVAVDETKAESKQNEERDKTQKAALKQKQDSEYLILVNKTHAVGSKKAPDDLIRPKIGIKEGITTAHDQLRKVPAKQFVKLVRAGKAENLEFVLTSAYRPYEYQKQIHALYAAEDGAKEANTYSAKAGHSEHETGLCLDVSSPSVGYSLVESYGETKEGKWLAANAHQYGFIIRYPKGKEKITGYDYEPWHIRYVGRAAAKEIYQKKITLEEYLGEE